MGPAWECPPEKLANGSTVYRCNSGHFHTDPSAAWACGPDTHSSEPESE